jgi:parvulin-like peptidyl-prolyl isomerase
VVTTQFGYHIIQLLGKTPAKKYGFTDMLPNIDKTVADVCKSEVEAQKIKELAPDYVKKLRSDLNVEIVDSSLKALDESVRARADAGGQTEPAK